MFDEVSATVDGGRASTIKNLTDECGPVLLLIVDEALYVDDLIIRRSLAPKARWPASSVIHEKA